MDVVEFAQVRTVNRRQKRRFKRFWARKCEGRGPGQPKVAAELRELIRNMSRANPFWGTPRIIGELEKLGITTCKATVDKYRVKRQGLPSPTWKSFLKNEGRAIAGIDFFTVPTARFRVLYVFIVIMHARRRIVHFNVTENPTAAWTAQQIVEAFPWDKAPKYLLQIMTEYTAVYLRKGWKAWNQGSENNPPQPLAECVRRKGNWLNSP